MLLLYHIQLEGLLHNGYKKVAFDSFLYKHHTIVNNCSFNVSVCEMKFVANEVFSDGSQEMEETLDDIEKSESAIRLWQCHIIRSVAQDKARVDALNTWLKTEKSSAVYIHLDWGMKWLPQSFREGQTSFFGKKGLSWHVAVAVSQNENGHLQQANFVHFFDLATQDSEAVFAILKDIFR